MEFFCAARINRELQYGRSNPLAAAVIPSEVLSFFADIGGQKTLEILNDLIYTYGKDERFYHNLMRLLSRVPLSRAIRPYLRCLVSFPSKDSVALDRQLRQRFGRLNDEEREETITQILDAQMKQEARGAEKSISRLLSLLKIDEFLIREFTDFLISGTEPPMAFGEKFLKLNQIRTAVITLGGFEILDEHLQKIPMLVPEEVIGKWAKHTNASTRLCKEILQRFDMRPDDCAEFLQNLRLRSHIPARAEEVLRSRDIDLIARDLRLSSSAAGEILAKSRHDRVEIKALFRQLKLRRHTSYMDDLRRISSLDTQSFRACLPLFTAAARKAGLLTNKP